MSDTRHKPSLPLPGLATVMVAALGLGVGWLVWQSDQERRAEQELTRRKEALHDPEAGFRERLRSIDVWVEEGAAVVPQLAADLEHPSPKVRAAIVQALTRIRPLVDEAVTAHVRSLDDPAAEVRLVAVAGLRALVEQNLLDRELYLPRLVRIVDDPDEGVRREALAMIPPWGAPPWWATPEVIAELIVLTRSEQPEVRGTAARLIRDLEAHGAEAVAATRRLLGDGDASVRAEAFRTLLASGMFTLDEVVAGLDSEDPETRMLACLALEHFGEDAAIATGRLRRLLLSGETWEVQHVMEALAAIGPAAEPAVPDVLELLERTPDEGGSDVSASSQRIVGLTRGTAFFCLARISTDGSLVVSTLRQGMFSPNRWTSRFAGEALREFSAAEARACVPELVAALAGREARDKVPLLTALGGLGPQAAAAVPALIELAGDETRINPHGTPLSYYTTETLGRMGAAAADAAPALAVAFEAKLRDSGIMSLTRLQALYGIGVRSTAAEAVLRRVIAEELELLAQGPEREADLLWTVSMAGLALGRVGRGSDAAHETLHRALKVIESHDSLNAMSRYGVCIVWALADLGVRPEETGMCCFASHATTSAMPPKPQPHERAFLSRRGFSSPTIIARYWLRSAAWDCFRSAPSDRSRF